MLDDPDNTKTISRVHESAEEENNPELVNNPKDLNKVLNKFDYGVISIKTGKKVDQKFYKSLSPLEFLKYKCGICWDFCAYQDKWFKNHNIKYSLYFVSAKTSTYKTHTFLIYQDKETKKFCIFESSWGKMQGIHEYNSEKEAMMDYFNKFKDDLPDKNKSTNKYLLMKYKQPLKYHLSANDYLNYIYNNGIIIINEGNIFNEDLKTKLDIIEVEANSMNNIKSISETVKLPEIKPKDIQFIKGYDGTNHSYIIYKGDNYRVRVETLIVNDKDEVYIDKSDKYAKYGIQYRIPGGSVEPDRDFVTQAENECKEEVHINIKNVYYSGQNCVMLFSPNSNSGIPNFSYKGCISYIYVAEYNGKYHGYVKVADRDDMYKTGKFYKYKDIKWLPAHKKALEDYFKSHKVLKESGSTMNDVIRTGKDQEYYKYLKIHEVRLKASFNDRIYALKNALLLSKEQCEKLKERILKHDASRYTPEEWDDWRKSYFPINDKEKEEGEESEKKARDHHYKVNAHHPEHWKGKEMDKISIAEMIIDWEADSKADGGNPLKWWLYNDEAKEKKKLLNPKTREEVERVLQTIYDVDMNLKDNFDRIDDPKKVV